MVMYSEISVAFMPASTTSILQPMDQGVLSTFKSYYLRNKFPKTTAAIDSDSADGSRQKKLKTFQKVFTTIDAFKNIHNSWQKVKNKNINRSLEEADSNFH